MIACLLISAVIAATGVTITEPADGGTYDGDWLTLRALVENGNEPSDSVSYSLNGETAIIVPRLSTDWYTYMADDLHTGFSESPAPMDNSILWTAPVTGDYHEFPTPVVVNGIVYYPQDSTGDSLFALDAATGELIWKYHTGYTDDAVTVKDGLLWTSSDSLWCLDARTGERIWAHHGSASAASTPAVDDDHVYSCRPNWSPGETYLYCLDRETGAEQWMVTLPGYAASCITVWNDMLFLPTYHGPLYCIDKSDGGIVWQNIESPQGYWDSSPVLLDSMIYILCVDGMIRAVDPASGNTVWSKMITSEYYLSATIATAYGRLFFADQLESFHCLEAEGGAAVWSVPGTDHGSAGVADGVVFYGEGSNNWDEPSSVYALSSATGDVIWSYYVSTGGPYGIVSSPSITDGVVYIAATDGNLYAFGTGLKYTYLSDLYAQVGTNELIVTSFDSGSAAAADTISFTVTGTGIEQDPAGLPDIRTAPNPFSSTAAITFELSIAAPTSVRIYDMAGREVVILLDSTLQPGSHTVNWNGTDEGGEAVSQGMYLCRIRSGGAVETVSLCLLR